MKVECPRGVIEDCGAFSVFYMFKTDQHPECLDCPYKIRNTGQCGATGLKVIEEEKV